MNGLFLAASCVLALAGGLALGHAVKARWRDLMPRWLPAAVLVPGLVPIAWHFRRISDFIAPVPEAAQHSLAARELETLSLALPFAVVAAWGLAILLTRRIPACAAAFPIAATALYLSGMAEAAPHVREVIDAHGDWFSLLIAAQLPATIAVASFLWFGLGRARLFASWPLRTR